MAHNIQHTTSHAIVGKPNTPDKFYYKMCARERCGEIILIEPTQDDYASQPFVLDRMAVVIYSGDAKHSFCSYKCAGLWCTNESKHGTENG